MYEIRYMCYEILDEIPYQIPDEILNEIWYEIPDEILDEISVRNFWTKIPEKIEPFLHRRPSP